MKTVGIIAEYNPFHTGHQYHIQKAKELTGADYAVVVMSPDFVQRGEPAVFDKYIRTKMALLSGADLVLQLPVCYATGSAEYFAEGAVSLLHSIGVTDTLCFGGESDDSSLFCSIAEILNQEPPAYLHRMKNLLRQGYTYPKARSQALNDYMTDRQQTSVSAFLSSPNNILGTEYCRALHKLQSRVLPLPLLRIGSQYNSAALSGQFASATAVRTALSQNTECSAENPEFRKLLSFIPSECQDIFLSAAQHPVSMEDFSLLLSQKLIFEQQFSSILDITPDLSDRILSLRYRCIGSSVSEVISILKTKQLTEARIRRALLHLLLGISSSSVENFRQNGTVFYARILGFKKAAAPLLHEIKKNSNIPVISKNAAAEGLLYRPETPDFIVPLQMWQQDIQAAHLFRAVTSSKYHQPFRTEYEYSPVIV